MRRGRGKTPGALCTRDKRNKTGCVGISLVRTNVPSGRVYRFYSVHFAGTNRKFNIDLLGKKEAWRRACELRAEFELAHGK